MFLQKIICAVVGQVRGWFAPRQRTPNELTQLFHYHPFIFGKTKH